jgi:hypothetical protein
MKYSSRTCCGNKQKKTKTKSMDVTKHGQGVDGKALIEFYKKQFCLPPAMPITAASASPLALSPNKRMIAFIDSEYVLKDYCQCDRFDGTISSPWWHQQAPTL